MGGSLESRAREPKRVVKPRGNGARVPRGEAARWRGFAATVAVLSPFHPQLHHSFWPGFPAHRNRQLRRLRDWVRVRLFKSSLIGSLLTWFRQPLQCHTNVVSRVYLPAGKQWERARVLGMWLIWNLKVGENLKFSIEQISTSGLDRWKGCSWSGVAWKGDEPA